MRRNGKNTFTSFAAERGFTLLEVVLSLALLTLSIGGLYSVIESSVARAQYIVGRESAVGVVQSALAEVLASNRFENANGLNGDYLWSVKFKDHPESDFERAAWRLVDIEVRVNWDERATAQSIVFRTRRILPTEHFAQ